MIVSKGKLLPHGQHLRIFIMLMPLQKCNTAAFIVLLSSHRVFVDLEILITVTKRNIFA